jgi:hypothetical protein
MHYNNRGAPAAVRSPGIVSSLNDFHKVKKKENRTGPTGPVPDLTGKPAFRKYRWSCRRQIRFSRSKPA